MREEGVESLGDLKYLTEKCIAEMCGHKAVHVGKVMEVIAAFMPAAAVSMPVATGVPFAAAPPLCPSSQQPQQQTVQHFTTTQCQQSINAFNSSTISLVPFHQHPDVDEAFKCGVNSHGGARVSSCSLPDGWTVTGPPRDWSQATTSSSLIGLVRAQVVGAHQALTRSSSSTQLQACLMRPTTCSSTTGRSG